MKTLHQILKIFLGCSVGVFLGSCIFQYYDFKTHPGLYAMQPTPWYLTLEIQGILTAVVAVGALTAMWMIRKKMNKKR